METKQRIKELRKSMGLSQTQFADKFDIPVRTLQQWEQGRSEPPVYVIKMMSYILLLEAMGK